jgi:chromosome segregation ATPase
MAEPSAADPEQRSRTVDDLADELDALQSRVNDAEASANKAKREAFELREELIQRDQRIDELEAAVEEQAQTIKQLRDRTGMLDNIEDGASLKIDKRAAILVQNLYNQAWKRKESSLNETPSASMDYHGAEAALGGGVDRANIMRTFGKAEELVDDDDLLWKEEEDRSSKKNTRLILDLSEGDAPQKIAGQDITQPEEN